MGTFVFCCSWLIFHSLTCMSCWHCIIHPSTHSLFPHKFRLFRSGHTHLFSLHFNETTVTKQNLHVIIWQISEFSSTTDTCSERLSKWYQTIKEQNIPQREHTHFYLHDFWCRFNAIWWENPFKHLVHSNGLILRCTKFTCPIYSLCKVKRFPHNSHPKFFRRCFHRELWKDCWPPCVQKPLIKPILVA